MDPLKLITWKWKLKSKLQEWYQMQEERVHDLYFPKCKASSWTFEDSEGRKKLTRKLKNSGRKSPPPSKLVIDNDDHASPPPSKLVLEDDDHAAGLTGILVALVATIFNIL